MYTFNGENMKQKDINHEENFNKMSELFGIDLKKLKLKKLPEKEDYDSDYNNNVVYAAKNIKQILKALYPKIKFSVKTQFYSGGNSINISWEECEDFNIIGPRSKEKKLLEKAFRYGDLDDYGDEENLLKPYGGVKFFNFYAKEIPGEEMAETQKQELDKYLKTEEIKVKNKNRL